MPRWDVDAEVEGGTIRYFSVQAESAEEAKEIASRHYFGAGTRWAGLLPPPRARAIKWNARIATDPDDPRTIN